jgi:phosphoribosylanthranilate isomerase
MKQKRVRIKMCGTTRAEDVEAAVAYGVDALGFIFVRRSPRFVSLEQAAGLIHMLPPFITRVGVFVNSPMAEVTDAIESCGLTQVQLHGDESPDFCRELKWRNNACSICKAFRVGEGSPQIDFDSYNPNIDSVLLDTFVEKIDGGTGKTFDWDIIPQLRLKRPLILAGGLHPGNVKHAVERVWPYAIDINSGVEQSPGIKDHRLLSQLIKTVRDIEHQMLVSNNRISE